MIQRTEPEHRIATSAWGNDLSVNVTRFEIEESDVGTKRDNYLGYGHQVYFFKQSDLGRLIEVHTDNTCWTYWFFV